MFVCTGPARLFPIQVFLAFWNVFAISGTLVQEFGCIPCVMGEERVVYVDTTVGKVMLTPNDLVAVIMVGQGMNHLHCQECPSGAVPFGPFLTWAADSATWLAVRNV